MKAVGAACARVGRWIQSGRAASERAARELAHDLAEFTLPQRCPACGDAATALTLLCDRCRASIPILGLALCARCLAAGREPAGCMRHPGFACWPAWVYDERAALVVQALKYHERPRLAAGLGDAIVSALPPRCRVDLVLAVPLHRARQRERGYDQAACLADAVAARLEVPRLDGVMTRIRATAPQARLGATLRRSNLSGAFRVEHPSWINERSVLIVDDVVTTGSTLEACLGPLRAAGAHAMAATLAWAQS